MVQKLFIILLATLSIIIVFNSCKKEDLPEKDTNGYIKYNAIVEYNDNDTALQDSYSMINSQADSWITKHHFESSYKVGFYRYSETLESYIYFRLDLDSLYRHSYSNGDEVRICLTKNTGNQTSIIIKENRSASFFSFENVVYDSITSRITGEFSFEENLSSRIQNFTGSFDVKLFFSDHVILPE